VLKKENRLQKEREFAKVFKGSRPISSKNLVLRVAKQNLRTEELKYLSTKFGFIISNKVNKLATGRNALKRQLRAIIENELPNIKTGYNVVIIVKQDFEKPYDQKAIKEQIVELLGKAGLLG